MANISFEVGNHKYQTVKLDVFDQMIIAKRLMPVLKNIITPEMIAMVQALPTGEPGKEEAEDAPKLKIDAAQLFPALAEAIYSLSDDDTKKILQLSLKGVQRQNPGGMFSPLLASSGGLMFQDVDMPTMLQIAWKVIEGHLGDFFSTAR